MTKRTEDDKHEGIVITPGGPRPASTVHEVRPDQAVRTTADGGIEIVTKVVHPDAPGEGRGRRSIPENYVMTPGGLRHRSYVHVIKPGESIDVADGLIRRVDPNRRVIQELGRVDAVRYQRPLQPAGIVHPSWPAPAIGTGWITHAQWFNNTGRAISSFRTTFTVPAKPLANSSPLIYIFNALQNATSIFQPVLQWGGEPGDDWYVATWLVMGSTMVARSQFVRVNPGDVLTGVITLTAQQAATGTCDYYGEFRAIQNSGLSVWNQTRMDWAFETLEAYEMNQCSEYPARKISMRDIEIQTGGVAVMPTWAPVNTITDCGQNTVVVSNASPGGQVDLYCYDLKRTQIANNADGRFEHFYTSRDNGIYHRWQTAASNGWAEIEWPLGFGNYARQITAARNQDGRLEVFYVGTDERVYHTWQTAPNNGWSGEHWLEGWAKQIELGQNADGRLEIFYVGTNDKVYHNWQMWPGGNWFGERDLGGWAKQLCVGRNADGRLEVFYVGTDDRVYHRWQVVPNGGWSGESWMGGWAKQIAVGRNADGRLEIFYVGTNNRVYHNWQSNSASGWSGETDLGGWAKQVAVASNADGRLEVAYIGTDDQLYHRWQLAPNSGWGVEAGLGGAARELSIGPNADGRLELFYVGTDGALYQNWQVAPNGGWSGQRRM
jgi:hypothetical protein